MKEFKRIHLMVYKGQKISYNANGSIQNENQKIAMNSDEFRKFLGLCNVFGYCKIVAENVDNSKAKAAEVQKEIDNAFNKQEEPPKQDQVKDLKSENEKLSQRLAEMEAKLNSLSPDENKVQNEFNVPNQDNEKPNESWTNNEIKNYLKFHEIEFNENDTKEILLSKIN